MLNAAIAAKIETISLNFVIHSIWAHGILMSVAFVILFPLGALTIRLFSFKGLVWVHAGLQLFAFTVALAAFGLGVCNAAWQQRSGHAHPIIGIVVIGLLCLQPLLGLIHHYVYARSHRRTFWAQAHVWFGRGLMALGMINGGLGMKLANNTVKGEIAYGIIGGVILVFYMGVNLIGAGRSSKGGKEGETAENITEKSAPAPAESQGQGQGLVA